MNRTLFYMAVVGVLVWIVGCSSENQTDTDTVLYVAPSANITVDSPLVQKGYSLILSNRSTTPITLKSISIYNDREQKLPRTEINGVSYFWYSTPKADYYMRLRIDTKYLITKDGSLFSHPDESARIDGVSGHICDSAELETTLYSPNLCDEAALGLVFENSCIIGNSGFELVSLNDTTFFVLLTPADSGYDGFASRNQLHLCGDSTLTAEAIKKYGPYSNEDLYTDGGAVDDTKLIAFCEESAGVWDQDKLSLPASSISLSELPLELVAYAVPKGSESKVPAQNFYLQIEHTAKNSPARILVKFEEGAAGNPVAQISLGSDVTEVLSSVIADASSSFSPVGAIREPFSYMFRTESLSDLYLSMAILGSNASSWSPQSEDLSNTWISDSSVSLWPLLVGNYRVYVRVKDNQGLTSDEVSADLYAVPSGKLYVELSWDNPDAILKLYLVRYRRHGSFLVPPVDEDIVNAPNGISCQSNSDCDPYFCSALSSGELMCTHHNEASHYDTCGDYMPNPVWGEPSNPDDDPKMIANYNHNGGPVSISISRPMQALYRVVVMLDPDTPRTINKNNPVNLRLAIYVKGGEYKKDMQLYFRPEDETLPDLVVWKAADISYSDSPEVTFIPTKDIDCYIPGQCPYANPFNAVVDAPFDPLDPDQPRSIWCDKAGDPECVE